jgi:RNA polymerase sigma-70 factor (ECF subfamily)
MENRDMGLLVAEARKGDRAAFQSIYEHYVRRIYNFLFRMAGSADEAEDLTQQTFLVVLQQLGTLRDASQLESWIYRIARNEVYQRFRKKKPGSIEDEGIELHGIPEERAHGNPEKMVLDLELNRVVQEVLNALAPKLREVFVMGVIQEMSYEEVAAIVGRSVSSVKTDVYRARVQIKDDLRGYMPGRLNATRRAPEQ